jgi:hypothetical protein
MLADLFPAYAAAMRETGECYLVMHEDGESEIFTTCRETLDTDLLAAVIRGARHYRSWHPHPRFYLLPQPQVATDAELAAQWSRFLVVVQQ